MCCSKTVTLLSLLKCRGVKKPACFIEVLPVSVTLENQFTEIVTNSVEITYHPAIETKEELIETAGKLKRLFLYTPLQVQDRFLSVNEIDIRCRQIHAYRLL